MNEKHPSEAIGDDTFVPPTAPPSYEEATRVHQGTSSYNPPRDVHQGYPANMPAAPQTVAPPGIPMYPPQPVTVPYPPGQHHVTQVPLPPPTGYPQVSAPSRPSTTTSVVISAPAAFMEFGPNGQRMRCVHCGSQIKTTTVSSYKSAAHICCLAICLFVGCFFSWIPYCLDACKKVDHICPSCNGYLGTYNG